MNKPSKNKTYWYALRITYSRELLLKTYLDQIGIDNFIPMRYEMIMKRGQRTRKLVPAVHNLIFIRSTRKKIDEIKEANTIHFPLRYIMDRETHSPIIIPEAQMQHFIAVAGNYDQQVIYLPPAECDAKKGDRIRITGGIFKDVEGILIRVKGDRRIMVSISGVMAVATAFVHPSLIERIDTQTAQKTSPQLTY